MEPVLTAVGFLALINIAAFGAFAEDKRRAEQGLWRISESSLLTLALLGGWGGAKLGQRQFRHKTRKEPFRTALNSIPAVWVILLGVIWFSGFRL